jgi:hypothetical protein
MMACTLAETCNLRNRCVVIDGLLNEYLYLKIQFLPHREHCLSPLQHQPVNNVWGGKGPLFIIGTAGGTHSKY